MEPTPHSSPGTRPDFRGTGNGEEASNNLAHPDELWDGLAYADFCQFCRGQGLNIPDGDMQSHDEAMKLFDELKPDYYERPGYIVHSRPWSSCEGFQRRAQPVEEFLAKVAKDRARLKKLEYSFALCADIFLLSLGFAFMFAFDYFTSYIFLGWLLLAGFFVGSGFTWRWFFTTRPQRAQERSRAILETKLEQFRQKLHETAMTTQTEFFNLVESALPKVASALAENLLNLEAKKPGDSERARKWNRNILMPQTGCAATYWSACRSRFS